MISFNSRYLLTDIIEITNPVTGSLVKPAFLDLRPRVTEKAADDRFVTIDSSRDWAHLAVNTLGDARHWWVIADLSDVIDPFEELIPGKQLRAPSVQRFLFNILAPDNT